MFMSFGLFSGVEWAAVDAHAPTDSLIQVREEFEGDAWLGWKGPIRGQREEGWWVLTLTWAAFKELFFLSVFPSKPEASARLNAAGMQKNMRRTFVGVFISQSVTNVLCIQVTDVAQESGAGRGPKGNRGTSKSHRSTKLGKSFEYNKFILYMAQSSCSLDSSLNLSFAAGVLASNVAQAVGWSSSAGLQEETLVLVSSGLADKKSQYGLGRVFALIRISRLANTFTGVNALPGICVEFDIIWYDGLAATPLLRLNVSPDRVIFGILLAPEYLFIMVPYREYYEDIAALKAHRFVFRISGGLFRMNFPGIPTIRDVVEFNIELFPGAEPILQSSVALATIELNQLKDQLQEIVGAWFYIARVYRHGVTVRICQEEGSCESERAGHLKTVFALVMVILNSGLCLLVSRMLQLVFMELMNEFSGISWTSLSLCSLMIFWSFSKSKEETRGAISALFTRFYDRKAEKKESMDPARLYSRFVEGFFTISLPLNQAYEKGGFKIYVMMLSRRVFSGVYSCSMGRCPSLSKFGDIYLYGASDTNDSVPWVKANVVADALSRKSGMIAGIKVEEGIIRDLERLDIELCVRGQSGFWASLRVEPNLISQIKTAQKDDGEIWAIIQNIDQQTEFRVDDDGILWQGTKLCVPEDPTLREALMTEAHSSPFSIHPGSTKMYHDLKQHFWWSGMKRDVATFVSKCLTCQQVKIEHQRASGLLQPLEIPVWKWDEISMDFVTGLPRTQRKHDAIWVVVDRLTKSAHFLPIRKDYPVSKLAEMFQQEIVRLHGTPSAIVSDRDPRFTSRFWKGLQKAWGTRLKFSTAFHPETDGQSERTIQTLEDMLRSCALEWAGNWDDYICLVGERILEGPEMIEVTNEKVAVAREKLKEAQTRQKSYADRHRRALEFQPGEHIFLKVSPTRGVRRFGIKGKLSPRFIGPSKIE
ncbi:DNA/RNA polymerases superfamily protein [Tanacetum coccineum]|uniref:DNA/RNA polymerases superfamily protein n=1 Tax=Tanacetum coccineum TaxID=301880 RepID=A0ABQ5J235_9ASTR